LLRTKIAGRQKGGEGRSQPPRVKSVSLHCPPNVFNLVKERKISIEDELRKKAWVRRRLASFEAVC